LPRGADHPGIAANTALTAGVILPACIMEVRNRVMLGLQPFDLERF